MLNVQRPDNIDVRLLEQGYRWVWLRLMLEGVDKVKVGWCKGVKNVIMGLKQECSSQACPSFCVQISI